jgi:hypothetical protein
MSPPASAVHMELDTVPRGSNPLSSRPPGRGGTNQGNVLLGAILTHRTPTRTEQGRRRRGSLDPERHLAPLDHGRSLRRPRADYFLLRHDPAVEAKRLQKRIEALGFQVTIAATAA